MVGIRLRWDFWEVFFMGATDKRTLVRGAPLWAELLGQTRMPVVAEADPDIEGSEILLKHFGFKQHGNVWVRDER
jgi:hypothetical protein